MEVLSNKVYHLDLDFSQVDYQTNNNEKVKIHPMTTEDFILLAEACFNSRSKGRLGPLLTATLGTRSEELVSIKSEDIDLSNNIVHLKNCKNGRNRDLAIESEFKFFWEYVKNQARRNNWETIFGGLKRDSYEGFIASKKKKLEISDKYLWEGNHSIRKMYARRRFSEEQLKGFNIKNSWEHVQVELGHGGTNREDLFKVYIGEDYKNYLNKSRENKFIPLLNKEEINRQRDFIISFKDRLAR